MQILGFNTLDLLLLVILFVGVLAGFVRGALSQIISAVSIWLGLVTTLWLYKWFSINILQGIGMTGVGSDTLSFLILLLVLFNAFRLIVRYLAKPPEEKKKRVKKKGRIGPIEEVSRSASQRFITGPFQAIGGMIMGFVLTTLWIALGLGLIQFIFQPTPQYTPSGGLVRNMNTSILVPYFNLVLTGLSQSVTLFVPRNADILRRALEFITT